MSSTTGDPPPRVAGSSHVAGWLRMVAGRAIVIFVGGLVGGLTVGVITGVFLGGLVSGPRAHPACTSGSSGCSGSAAPGFEGGAALGVGGSAGIVVTPARPPANRIVLYAFPWLANASPDPVSVVGFALSRVPRNVVVQRFVVLDARETGGRLSTANLGGRLPRFDVRRYRNYAGVPIVVPPGAVSRRYVLVQLRKVGPVDRLLTGCVVYYRTRGASFHQRLPCGLKLWGMR